MIITNDLKLELDVPYMLRSDGQLFDCGDTHPYIKYNIQDTDENQIRYLLNNSPHWLKWYFNNTDSILVKSCIHDFLDGVFSNNDNYKVNESVINYFSDIWALNFDSLNFSVEKTNKIFRWLNSAINMEFTRLIIQNSPTTSNNRSLCCRIGDPNILNSGMWIKYLRLIVKEHQKDIDYVTVITDIKSTGDSLMYYRLNNKDINCMPVNEFVGP